MTHIRNGSGLHSSGSLAAQSLSLAHPRSLFPARATIPRTWVCGARWSLVEPSGAVWRLAAGFLFSRAWPGREKTEMWTPHDPPASQMPASDRGACQEKFGTVGATACAWSSEACQEGERRASPDCASSDGVRTARKGPLSSFGPLGGVSSVCVRVVQPGRENAIPLTLFHPPVSALPIAIWHFTHCVRHRRRCAMRVVLSWVEGASCPLLPP